MRPTFSHRWSFVLLSFSHSSPRGQAVSATMLGKGKKEKRRGGGKRGAKLTISDPRKQSNRPSIHAGGSPNESGNFHIFLIRNQKVKKRKEKKGEGEKIPKASRR